MSNLEMKRYKCCYTKTGWHCICRRFRKTDISNLGEGIVLYFMMLKYLICLFFFISILSIPALFFYYNGDAIDSRPYLNVGIALSAFSMGNLGESNNNNS